MSLITIDVRPGHPDFLDLPWQIPLQGWADGCPRLVQMQRGLSRHEVCFVDYGGAIYALKELPADRALLEYDLLRQFADLRLPAVEAVGHARTGQAGEERSVLITRFLDFSLPYRTLFMQPGLERYRERLLDAVGSLLVRLHLAGCFWGDCSLSNTLFRRDAGALQAYLVDAETAEVHERLSDGQRSLDLEIMEENLVGERADLAALIELPATLDLYQTGPNIRARYQRLWEEVTREEILAPQESWRIHERIRTLNGLGFSVDEVELVASGEGSQLRMRTVVTDRDYHRHLLHNLTGLVAGERQAELLLNEIHELRATLSRERNRSVPLSAAAFQWTSGRFQPAADRLGAAAGLGEDATELYCQILEHKWFLSERAQRDVGLDAAMRDYLGNVRGLRVLPDGSAVPDSPGAPASSDPAE